MENDVKDFAPIEDFADWFEDTFRTSYLPFNNSSDSDIGDLLIRLYRHPQRVMRFSSWLITTRRGDIFEGNPGERTPEEVKECLYEHYQTYIQEFEKGSLWIPQGFAEAEDDLFQELFDLVRKQNEDKTLRQRIDDWMNHGHKNYEQTGKRTDREELQ